MTDIEIIDYLVDHSEFNGVTVTKDEMIAITKHQTISDKLISEIQSLGRKFKIGDTFNIIISRKRHKNLLDPIPSK